MSARTGASSARSKSQPSPRKKTSVSSSQKGSQASLVPPPSANVAPHPPANVDRGGSSSSSPKKASQKRMSRAMTRCSTLGEDGKKEAENLIGQLFDLTDVNGNGVIGFGEFVVHHERVMDASNLPGVTVAQAENEFRKADADSNYGLDKEEFRHYMNSLLAILGGRAFKTMCEALIETEKKKIEAQSAGFDWRASERLVEQARNTNHYRLELKNAAVRFLEQKADPNFKDSFGSSILLYAVEKAEADFIQRLLDFKASPLLLNNNMECAAFLAAKARHLEATALLLNCAPDRNENEAEKLGSQLVMNISTFTGAEVDELLTKRANMNYKDKYGWAPLTAAVCFGSHDIVETLLRKGASAYVGRSVLKVNGINGRGRAALHLAARKGKPEAVKALIRARADVDMRDNDGWTALHHAAFNGGSESIEALVAANADMLLQGRQGWTPWLLTKSPHRAGDLSESSINLLRPVSYVDYGKNMAPILKDSSKVLFDKVEALLELRGVNRNARNLRMHEQFFDPVHGPNKVRLAKTWEELARPLLERLHSGAADLLPLETNDAQVCEDDRRNRLLEIDQRQKEQRRFVQVWLKDTRGLMPGAEWRHENRGSYGSELQEVCESLLRSFQTDVERLYTEVRECDGGKELCLLPQEEILVKEKISQLAAHPIQAWLEEPDTAEAIEALRLVGAAGRSDQDSVLTFVDIVNLGHDFDTGKTFWRNIYKKWLAEYATLADPEFQKAMKGICEKFNLAYEEQGLSVSYRVGKPKSYDRMRVAECKHGEPDPSTFEGRVVAAHLLDLIRGSFTANTPRAALTLLNEFFRPMKSGRLRLARICNRLSEALPAPAGYRYIELNLWFNSGSMVSRCGRPGNSLQLAVIGEVQIHIDKLLNLQKRRNVVERCLEGAFDWSPQEVDQVLRNSLAEEDD